MKWQVLHLDKFQPVQKKHTDSIRRTTTSHNSLEFFRFRILPERLGLFSVGFTHINLQRGLVAVGIQRKPLEKKTYNRLFIT